MRKPFIAGNWKMYKTVHDTLAMIRELRARLRDASGVDVVVAPPFTALYAAADAARDSIVGISAQNLHWEREGAFTGEVSAAMIREAGALYVIVGALRAANAVRRDQPERQQEAGGGAWRAADADPVRRRNRWPNATATRRTPCSTNSCGPGWMA